MNARSLVFWLVACASAFVGVALDRISGKSLRLTPEINISDLLTLLVTVVIAVSIPTILQKSINIRDFKKKQLIARIEGLILIYKSIDSLYQNSFHVGTLDANTKTALLMRVRDLSNEIAIIVDLCNAHFPSHVKERVKDLKSQRIKLNRQISGGQFSSLTSISPGEVSKVSKIVLQINKDLSNLVFELNTI